MKRFLFWMMFLGGIACSFLYLEWRYHAVSAFMAQDMTDDGKQAYILELHDQLLEKKEKIVLQYQGDAQQMEAFVKDSIDQAFAVDDPDTSSDYDYMQYVHAATHISMNGLGRSYTVVYELEYLETEEQTREVDRKVKRILKEILQDGMTDYEKIFAIHEYIIDHVEYDMSTNKNSPYYALVEHTSACQGYATLLYKMATEAGIPCRVITGTAKGGLHAWNIVKIGDYWYNIDATWDDPVGAFGKIAAKYRYFLKSDAEMTDHKRDDKFLTTEFTDTYKMASESY